MFIYAALGDSITAGLGASSPAKAYTQGVVRILRSRSIPAVKFVMAEPGLTSAELLQSLGYGLPSFRQASGITVWIGGDDLIHAGFAMLQGAGRDILEKTLLSYRHNLLLIVRKLRNVSPARIIVCTQYNPFPNTALAVKAIGQLNGITAEAAKLTGCAIAPVHEWFQGKQPELLRGYRTGRLEDALAGTAPIHPNNRGHQVIATGISAIFY